MPYYPRHDRQLPSSGSTIWCYTSAAREEYEGTPVQHDNEDAEQLEALHKRTDTGLFTQEDAELQEQLRCREEDRRDARTAPLRAELEGYFRHDHLVPLPPPVLRSSLWLERSQASDYEVNFVREFLVACGKGSFWIMSNKKKAAFRQMGLNDALVCAAREHHVEVCKYLLDIGAQITSHVVQEACEWRSVKLFEVLLQHGYHPNQQIPSPHGYFGTALLHCLDSVEVTELLLTHGADPNLAPFHDRRTNMWSLRSTPPMDRKSGFALDDAVKQHDREVVRLLLEHGAKTEYSRPFLKVVHGRNNVYLNGSRAREWRELFDLFLSYGADINARSWNKGTVLSYVVSGRTWDIAEYLLRHGADPRMPGLGSENNRDALKTAAGYEGLQWGTTESEDVAGYIGASWGRFGASQVRRYSLHQQPCRTPSCRLWNVCGGAWPDGLDSTCGTHKNYAWRLASPNYGEHLSK